ncbi:unnamed protein product, partial [marine sediment metagenome]
MDKEEYQNVSDNFSKIIRGFFITMSTILSHEFGIEFVVCGHAVYLHPTQIKEVRGSTFAMGCKDVLLGIPDVMKEELEKYFEEVESEELKKDITKAFGKILITDKNKK